MITLNLPAGTLGQEIAFADYAGTFDSNTFTIAANGFEKILGSTADFTVSVESAANTLVYTDSTQGWLLKNKEAWRPRKKALGRRLPMWLEIHPLL